MMDIQAFVDAICEQGRVTRGKYQMTLGELISALTDVDESLPVRVDIGGGVSIPMSYRGYYSDLAFDPTFEIGTAEKFKYAANDSLGKTFTGYKGGDFTMNGDTPLWISGYGECSDTAIMGIEITDDAVSIKTRQIEG